jgi:hypothetical protein
VVEPAEEVSGADPQNLGQVSGLGLHTLCHCFRAQKV